MFSAIFYREFKKVLRSPAFYLLLVAVTFLAYRDASIDKVGHTMINYFGHAWHNAPLFIARDFAFFGIVTLLFSIVLVCRSVVKDFEAGIHPFFFTAPITKEQYLFGRFFGGLAATAIAYLGIIAGIIVGSASIADTFSGPQNWAGYAFGFFVILLPLIFIISSVFFALATLTRKMFLTYLAGVAVMMLFGMVSNFLQDGQNEWFKILIDPSGLAYLDIITADWTVSDINNQLIPMEPEFVLNRILWIGISVGLLLFTWKRFRLVELEPSGKWRIKQVRNKPMAILEHSSQTLEIPTVRYRNNKVMRWKQVRHLIVRDLWPILRHPAFLVITFLAMRQIYVNFTDNVGPNGSNVYALTSWYLRFVDDIYTYMLPITIFFGGVLVWKERDQRTDEFYNTSPMPRWTGYATKLLVLMGVQAFYVLVVFLTGVSLQLFVFDFTDINFGLYAQRLIGIDLINYLHIAILVIFIQVLSGNKYVGFFICALFYAVDILLMETLDGGFEMLRYGFLPAYDYSNLSGFGHFAEMLIAYRIYWIFPAVIIVMASIILWPPGKETNLKIRLKAAQQNATPKIRWAFVVAVILALGSGGYITYNNYVLNEYVSPESTRAARADYEKNYKHYELKPAPSITGIELNVDLFPDSRYCQISGQYQFINKSSAPIQEVFINLTDQYISDIRQMELYGAEIELQDRKNGVRIYRFEPPLNPGETTQLSFDFEINIEGFSSFQPKNAISENGSIISNLPFFGAHFLPEVGYNIFNELMDSRHREEYGLEQRTVFPDLDNSEYIRKKPSDFVHYRAEVSTSADQTVVSNGRMVKHWQEGRRNFYQFETDTLINNAIVIASGRYEERSVNQGGVELKVFYDKRHAYNVDRMIRGMEVALEYCTKNFGPYPYGTVKIVEVNAASYPGSGTAMSIPTIFAWQENGGFISNLEDPDAMDVVFNTTTHEFAHQWWGHMVRPAMVEGAAAMSETMAQWVRIMCQQREFGEEKALEFLGSEMDWYLRWRQRDFHGERPMIKTLNQAYLNYAKGTVVMYAMQSYIGEHSVNTALRRLVERFGLKDEEEYVTTRHLVKELRRVTPDSLQYLVTDLFEQIVLYKFEAVKAKAEESDGRFTVRVELNANKVNADARGVETEMPMNDYVPVALLDDSGEMIHYEMVKLKTGSTTLTFSLKQQPASFHIDPKGILIERQREDNKTIVNVLR